MLECPNCGRRHVGEFSFRGEYRKRPSPDAELSAWTGYVFTRKNRKGKQVEWWYHTAGCQRWFLVERDTTNSVDHESYWFGESE